MHGHNSVLLSALPLSGVSVSGSTECVIADYTTLLAHAMPSLKKDKKKIKKIKNFFFTLYIVVKKKIIKNKLWHGKKG